MFLYLHSTPSHNHTGSKDNRRPLSFVSYYQITKEIQPELEGALESKRAQQESGAGETSLTKEIQLLESGVQAWEEILRDYEATNKEATSGRSKYNFSDYFKQRKEQKPFCQKRTYKAYLYRGDSSYKDDAKDQMKAIEGTTGDVQDSAGDDIAEDGDGFGESTLDSIEPKKYTTRRNKKKRWYLRAEYRCTTVRDEYPSPIVVFPDITEVCRDFTGDEHCLNRVPDRDVKELSEWKALSSSHQYYKVSLDICIGKLLISLLLTALFFSFDVQIWRFKNPSVDLDVNLAPSDLEMQAEKLSEGSTVDQDIAENSKTKSIEFSGGGGVISFEFEESKSDHLQEMWNSPLENAKNQDYATAVGGEGEFAFDVGFGIMAGKLHTEKIVCRRARLAYLCAYYCST